MELAEITASCIADLRAAGASQHEAHAVAFMAVSCFAEMVGDDESAAYFEGRAYDHAERVA